MLEDVRLQVTAHGTLSLDADPEVPLSGTPEGMPEAVKNLLNAARIVGLDPREALLTALADLASATQEDE